MLPAEFFNRNSVVVAKDLLGKFLCRKIGSKIVKSKILETEAYEGLKDLASHASRGKTDRNAPMFERSGTVYTYFTYGMHWMLNIVFGPENHPAAVLIRGVEDCSGPGRLTKYLNIDKKLNGKTLGKKTGLWVENSKIERLKIEKLPRVGVAYAGPVWSKKKYRFLLKTKPTSANNKLR